MARAWRKFAISFSPISIGCDLGQFGISGCKAEITLMRKVSHSSMVILRCKFHFGSIISCTCLPVTVIILLSAHVFTQYVSNCFTNHSIPGHVTGIQYVSFLNQKNGILLEVNHPLHDLPILILIPLSNPITLRAPARCSSKNT